MRAGEGRAILRERPFWILLAAVALFFWRPLTGQTFFFRDLYLLFFGRRLFFADAIRSGEIPLWDPLLHGGQPFLADPANSPFYPSNVLFLVLPALTAFNLNIVLHFVLCAATMYFAARALDLSPAAAFAGGAVYALCGYVLSSANLMILLQALPWPPLLLGAAHLAFTDGHRRWLVVAAIAGALPLLAVAAEMAAMSLALTIVWSLVVPHRVPLRRRLGVVAAIGFFAVGLSLVQTVPASEVFRNSSRPGKVGFNAFAQWSVSPNRLPELVVPRFFGPTDTLARTDYWGGPFEFGFPYIMSLYFGAVTLLLAAAGALRGMAISRNGRVILAAFAGAGFLLSLGGYLPFFGFLYEHIPLIGIFRFPVKALLLALVPLALLAAAGIDALATTRRSLAISAAALTLAFGGVFVAFASSESFRMTFTQAFFGVSLSPAAVRELTLSLAHPATVISVFFLLLLFGRTRNVAGAVAALLFADLALAGARVNVYTSRELFEPPPLASRVRALLGGGKLFRTHDPYVMRLRIPSNENVWLAWWDYQLLARYTAATFGIPLVFHDDFDGLAPLRIRRMTDALARMKPAARLPVFAAAGATVLLTPDELAGTSAELVETLTDPDGKPLYLYRNPTAHPLRFASEADFIADDPSAFRILATRSFDPNRVILSEPPTQPLRSCRGARVRTVSRSINQWTAEVVTPCTGYLVFAETHYPGWKATVDGRPARIIRADVAFSSVAVSAGRHFVTKTYRPRLPLFGAVGTFVAIVFLVVLSRIRGPERPEFTAISSG
jgi:hypothetical protein